MTISKELTKVWQKHFKGLSLRQIGIEAGLSASTISRVLGKQECDPATHDKINTWILSKKGNQKRLIKKLSQA